MDYLKKGLSFYLYFHKNQLQGGPSWWIYAWFRLLIVRSPFQNLKFGHPYCNMTLMLCSGQATRLLNFGSIVTTVTPSCSSASRNIKPYEPSANPLSLVPFSITKQLSSSWSLWYVCLYFFWIIRPSTYNI